MTHCTFTHGLMRKYFKLLVAVKISASKEDVICSDNHLLKLALSKSFCHTVNPAYKNLLNFMNLETEILS